MDGISPETELLLCCGRTQRDGENTFGVRRLTEGHLDWERVLRMTFRHGLVPTLFSHLSSICPDAVPRDVMLRLRSRFEQIVRRNLFLTGELCRVLSMLDVARIPAIAFKGPALAHSIYGSVALREFVDIDIIVHKEDVLRAKSVLLGDGYGTRMRLEGVVEAAWLRWQGEYEFLREDHGRNVLLEVHWAFAPSFFSVRLDPEPMWNRLKSISLGGSTVRTLSPEDTVLALCVHNGVKHLWSRLSWVLDFAQMARSGQGLDWDWTLREARNLGIERALLVSLLLARDIFGATLPVEVLTSIRSDPTVKSISEVVRARLIGDGYDRLSDLRSHLFRLRLRERLCDKARYCLQLAHFPREAEWATAPESSWRNAVYAYLRPARLIGRYVGVAARRFR